MIQELLRVFSAVPIQAFHAGSRVTHDNDLICNIYQVYFALYISPGSPTDQGDLPKSKSKFLSLKRALSPETKRRM